MIAGLVIKLTEGIFIQNTVSFDYQFFFNLLLPPIILGAGYELHQVSGPALFMSAFVDRQLGELFP